MTILGLWGILPLFGLRIEAKGYLAVNSVLHLVSSALHPGAVCIGAQAVAFVVSLHSCAVLCGCAVISGIPLDGHLGGFQTFALNKSCTVKHLVHLLFPVLHSCLGRDFLEVRWLGQRLSASVILPSQPDPSPEVLCVCPPVGFLRALPGPSDTGTFWTLKDNCVYF